jgi:DNA-binding NtrC family response regulator
MGEKKKILVVDDEDFIRKLSTRILSLQGYETIQAADGQQAVEIYRNNQDDIILVLLDIRMPGISGVQTFKKLISINQAVRIILCSGFGEYHLAVESGCFFIQKPFSVTGLTELVKKVISMTDEEIIVGNQRAECTKFLEEIDHV